MAHLGMPAQLAVLPMLPGSIWMLPGSISGLLSSSSGGVTGLPTPHHSGSDTAFMVTACSPGASEFTSLTKDCLLPNKLHQVLSVGGGSSEALTSGVAG